MSDRCDNSQQQALEDRARVTVREASREELADALRVQHAAFTRVADSVGVQPTEMPPVSETLVDIERLHDEGMRTFVATVTIQGEAIVIGTVRGLLRDDKTVEIGRLAVDGAFLRKGIARALMAHLESAFPSANRFELFTASEASQPLALYASIGYRIYAEEQHEHWTLVRLEKSAPACTPAR